jgi:hypothetical protein
MSRSALGNLNSVVSDASHACLRILVVSSTGKSLKFAISKDVVGG